MQSQIKHNRLALLSSLVAGAFILAACGGGNEDKAPEQAAADMATQAQAESDLGIEISHDFEHAQATATWITIAQEQGAFTVGTNSTVRYGAADKWITKTVSGKGECSNTFFGSDPIFGTKKHCELQGTSTTTEPVWTAISNEWEDFTVNTNTTVRYGAVVDGVGYWTSKAVSGKGSCTNDYFGKDPKAGVPKACYVQGDNVATAPPAQPPASTTTSANLTWSASTSNASGYRVYYGTTSGSYAQAMGSGSPAAGTTYTVTGLESGKTYYFAVTAVDSTGRESGYSNEAKVSK